MSEEVAKDLLETRSVYVNLKQPFTLTSGRRSPVYVDCRRLISYPKIRYRIVIRFAEIVAAKIGVKEVDVIAGGETAGIPYAAFLAVKLNKPMVYVRKTPKGHGRSAQIEGVLNQGDRVLLVEDLVTDGESKLQFKAGIETAGGRMTDCLCVFEYRCDRLGLQEARENLARHDIRLHSLATWDDVLSVMEIEGRFSAEQRDELLRFLKDPEGWEEEGGDDPRRAQSDPGL